MLPSCGTNISHTPRSAKCKIVLDFNDTKQNRGTDSCSKLKSPETRQVQERLVSTLEHLQVTKLDQIRRPEELVSSVCIPHPLQKFYGYIAQLGKKSNSVIRSRLVTWSNIGAMSGQWRVSLYMVIIQNVV